MKYECLLVSDFTIDPLRNFLKDVSDESIIKSYIAPFNQVRQTLSSDPHDCCSGNPNILVVWTLPDNAILAFSNLLYKNESNLPEIEQEVKEYVSYIKTASSYYDAVVVVSWTIPYYNRGNGILDYKNKIGVYNTLMRMNLQLADLLNDFKNVFILNAERWMAATSEPMDDKMWFLGKIPFTRDVFSLAAQEIKTVIRTIRGKSRKIIVLDLDNTLWGGIVGDVGVEGLILGGIDPIGEAYIEFQKQILALKQRGIILAIASKNEESVALYALDHHPEMLLRSKDFVSWRINWNDKAANIAEMINEVNLSLDSVVFIDDNPGERERVAQALPQVYVPDWPSEPIFYKRALNQLACFDTLSFSNEDSDRTRIYHEENKRKQYMEQMPSVTKWLESLNLEVEYETVSPQNVNRTVQLINKTNQFNLLTRRLTQAELEDWTTTEGQDVFVFRARDKFGDYGIIGACSYKFTNDDTMEIVDFLLSCRTMGRGIEKTMLYVLAECYRKYGKKKLTARYIPTKKNKPCLNFLTENGFIESSGIYICNNINFIKIPSYINLQKLP